MNIFCLADAAAAAGQESGELSPLQAFLTNYSGFLIIIVFFVIMYFFIVRPQKKKDKEAAQMRDSLEVGDEVVTIGGVVGKVVNVKDDTVIIETGGDRNRLTFLKTAISSKSERKED